MSEKCINFSEALILQESLHRKKYRTSSPIPDMDLARSLGLIIINERKFADEIEKLDNLFEHVDEMSKRHLRRLKDIEIAVMRVKW